MKISSAGQDWLLSALDAVDNAVDEDMDSEASDTVCELRRYLNEVIGDMEVDE